MTPSVHGKPDTTSADGGEQVIHCEVGTPHPESTPPPSSSSRPPSPDFTALRPLRTLDMSSPEFHDQLSNVLRDTAYKRSVSTLQGDHLVLLVNYLNEVCYFISIPPST